MSGFFRTLSRVGVLRLMVMGFLLVAALGFLMAFHFEVGRKHLPAALDFAATAALCGALAGFYALLVRMFERRWPSELAPRAGIAWAALGALLGLCLFCTVYLILTILGVASWHGFQGFSGVGEMLLMAIVAGVGEELLFRAVLFRVVEESLGTTLAIVVSSVLFGLLHSPPGGFVVDMNTTAITLEAGLMLAAAYTWSRNLWLPIGIHAAWNFTEGGLFGTPVSGHDASGVLAVSLSPSASSLLTGGAFGPEGSVVAIGVCVALSVVFLILTVRAGHWRKLTFRPLLDREPARVKVATDGAVVV